MLKVDDALSALDELEDDIAIGRVPSVPKAGTMQVLSHAHRRERMATRGCNMQHAAELRLKEVARRADEDTKRHGTVRIDCSLVPR